MPDKTFTHPQATATNAPSEPKTYVLAWVSIPLLLPFIPQQPFVQGLVAHAMMLLVSN